MQVDFGRTSSDYARHRAGFPDAFFERLARQGLLRPGLRAVDLGTGTGTVARGLARHGCTVTALDVSAPMLESARGLATEAGLRIDFHQAPAERTDLPSEVYDLFTAGQCWHWFDRPAAAREAARLLAPGGRLVIAHFDWLPLPGNVVAATEDLILAHNPDWSMAGGTGLHPRWLTDLATAGFRDIETFSFDLDVPYRPEDWVGRIRASAGVGASLPEEGVRAFSDELTAVLRDRFPGDPLHIPHRTWAVTARKPLVA